MATRVLVLTSRHLQLVSFTKLPPLPLSKPPFPFNSTPIRSPHLDFFRLFGNNFSSLFSTLSISSSYSKKFNVILSQLGQETPPKLLLQKLVEQSRAFRLTPGDVVNSISSLKDLGFSNLTIVTAMQDLPLVFLKDLGEVDRKVELLKRFGLRMDAVDSVCRHFPGFLSVGFDRRLKPLFMEFLDLGFARSEIKKAIRGDPGVVLSLEVGEMSRCVELVHSLKCRKPIKERIVGNGLLRAAIDVKCRVDCLCKYGLIRRDAFKVLFVEPRVILYDVEDVKRKIEFLICTMKFGVEYLVEFPEFLGSNFEKDIIPRHNVIEHLRSVGALGDPVEMKHFVKMSRLKFYNFFVKPYPECEKIFGGLVREKEIKPRHPTGMWKLFKPQKHPGTQEDVKNMRLFMESVG